MNQKVVVFAAGLVVGCFSAGNAAVARMRAEITGKPEIKYEIAPKTECRKEREKTNSKVYGRISGCTVPSLRYDVSIDCSRKVLKIKLSLNFVVQVEQWVRELNDKIEFDRVLKHELTHVALYKNVYQKYAQSAASAALAYVNKNTCSNEAVSVAYKVMSGVHEEAKRQNALIDGEENYSYQQEQAWMLREKEQRARRQREEAAARKAEEKREKQAAWRRRAVPVVERPQSSRLQTRLIAQVDTPVKMRRLQKIRPADVSGEQREETGTPPTATVSKTSEVSEKRSDIIDALERFADNDLKKSVKNKMPNASDELIDGYLKTMDPVTKMQMEAANVAYKVVEADKEHYRRQKQARKTQKSPKQLSDEFRKKYDLPDPTDNPDGEKRTFRPDRWAYDWIAMVLDDLDDKIRYREKFEKIRDALKRFFAKKDDGAKKPAATK